MREYIMNFLADSSAVSIEEVFIRIIMAAIMGLAIYISYLYTHAGTIYSRKFNISLIVLSIITATVMIVIGNNVALSLGMVGALSIVRFRTAIKDSRDTVYIFWAIITGICSGAGEYLIGAAGTIVTLAVFLLMGRVKNDGRVLLIMRGPRANERKMEAVIFDYFNKKAKLCVKNSTKDSMELIYEISKKMIDASLKKEKSITEALYEIENMEYVNIVSQNDEIN